MLWWPALTDDCKSEKAAKRFVEYDKRSDSSNTRILLATYCENVLGVSAAKKDSCQPKKEKHHATNSMNIN